MAVQRLAPFCNWRVLQPRAQDPALIVRFAESWSWRWLPAELLDPYHQGRLTGLSFSFFRALDDQNVEFQPVHHIIQDHETALKHHLHLGEAHWAPLRVTCHEILVSVGRVSPSRADKILAGIPARETLGGNVAAQLC